MLRLERGSGATAALEPEGRELPVVHLEPQGPPAASEPPPEPARRTGRTSKSITLRTPTPDPDADDQGMWTDHAGFAATPESQPPPAGDDSPSYRLVGSRLVELTKENAPTRPDRPGRGRKAQTIVDEYENALAVYRAGEYVDAQARFEAFARAHPKHDYADNALYWKGEAAYDQQHYGDALAAFTEVVERYGGGNKAPDALLKIGLCYQKLGDQDNAKDVLSQLIVAYPGARASNIARTRLAEIEI